MDSETFSYQDEEPPSSVDERSEYFEARKAEHGPATVRLDVWIGRIARTLDRETQPLPPAASRREGLLFINPTLIHFRRS